MHDDFLRNRIDDDFENPHENTSGIDDLETDIDSLLFMDSDEEDTEEKYDKPFSKENDFGLIYDDDYTKENPYKPITRKRVSKPVSMENASNPFPSKAEQNGKHSDGNFNSHNGYGSKFELSLVTGSVTFILSVICVAVSVLGIIGYLYADFAPVGLYFFMASVICGIIVAIFAFFGVAKALKKEDLREGFNSRKFQGGYVALLLLSSEFTLVAVIISFLSWVGLSCIIGI